MIRFSADDWQRCAETYRAFWHHELERPIAPVEVSGLDPQREPPAESLRHFIPQYGDAVSAEAIIDSWDHHLSSLAYLGDAFPGRWLNCGAGSLAMPLGARAGVDERTVWFHPQQPCEADELDLHYDPAHPWMDRLAGLIAAAGRRWGDQVQIGMTDIGGVYDVLSSFLPGEELLLALYDDPAAVKHQAEIVEEAWWTCFRQVDDQLRAVGQRGWNTWANIWAPGPTYMFQCDFCYMISPAMFAEFVMPELSRSFAKVPYAAYHLDGVGELAHLDQLLADPNLKLIQWVPGDGQPGAHAWHEVFQRILDAGKLAQVVCPGLVEPAWEQVERLLDKLGTGKGLCIMQTGCTVDRIDEAVAWLDRLGVPEPV